MNKAAKGKQFEQRVARLFREAGFSAHRYRLSGQGRNEPDVVVHLDRERTIECKKKKGRFGELYLWTDNADMAVICADRKEPLVVMPLEMLLEMLNVDQGR